MVPRPRLNRELAHRHIVTMSTSTVAALTVSCQPGGAAQWSTFGIAASPNASVSFSLAAMVFNIGGLPAINCPNPSVAELQQLYDLFQIEKVELTVFSGNTESIAGNDVNIGYQFVLPLIGYSVDTDDDANTSLTQLQQYSTYGMYQLGQTPMRCSMVPCPAITAFGVGYARGQKQDINVSQAATPHYGFKMAIDSLRSNPPAGGNNTYVSIQARVHYIMKCTR